ncbi:2-polyprenyl-6-methoxyphenol hydroxylase-like FAD-dependent oxidoreductase [Cryobacterium sp. MP_3.1]|uniref:Monooxygenase n=1 Tax=Cryobacterium zongtaii TaxID=1259217 RepID=A0A2S3ZNW3_9MICO|nr:MULTISPECIES: FAD-dependent monooxygenase [Cryobacterium]MEC5184765.1 2-polyprenyl-6-methoxyphenol hydroxylase-like FAD-dependent oxidoreductase [Cryobacterium sp. MP_3.1]POH70772.1 monooxygenase [Cryobacterium zongtaii]
MTDFDTDLLIVGAGTTGLTLALQAVDHGARVRIVERRPEAFRPSRAMVMHPRTLELLRPLGVTDALLALGDSAPSVRLHLPSRVVSVSIEKLDLPGTAFPHPLLVRQSDVEAVLAAALAERGVLVQRGAEVVRLARLRQGGARAVLRTADDEPDEDVLCRYLAGCDGPASLVRRSVGGFLGGDYDQEVVLADVELGPAGAGSRAVAPVMLETGVAHVVVGRQGLVFLFNIGERATWRMLATRRAGDDRQPFGQPGPPVPQEQLQRLVDEAGLPAQITEVAWSAQVRLQHRIASRFSRGPLFVAGDAAHVHSPAGAQGMNAGIHDAVNLGWKLAFAAAAGRRLPETAAAPGDTRSAGSLAARPGSALLDSYALERRPADRAVLRLTHAMYWAEASLHPLAQLGRAVLVPVAGPLLPWLTRQRRLTAVGIRTLSQFRLRYRNSPLSMDVRASLTPVRGGLARRVLRPGSRVADTLVRCEGRRVRLHALLARPGVHILMQADARPVPERMLGPLVHSYRLDDRPGTGMLVVRPDGYVGLRAPVLDEPHLAAWLRLVGLPVR